MKRTHRPEMLRQHATEVRGFTGRRSAWGDTKTSVVVLVVGFWMRLFFFLEAGNKKDP